MRNLSLLFFIALFGITSCSSTPPEEQQTLATIDTAHGKKTKNEVFVKPKSEEEIKAAYYDYIKNAPSNDNSRLSAMNRLTELEMNRVNDISKKAATSTNSDIDDAQYKASLIKTRDLMLTSLREFPNAKDNDKTLYQLAKTYDLLDDHDKSLEMLTQIAEKYPLSPHYAEAQFRVGENAFVYGDFLTAEHAYTEAILSSSGDVFYERSIFKRGWSRYKQKLYSDAADDYIDGITHHNFADYDKLSKSDKDQFDEYFRALGLCMANLGSTDDVHKYLADKSDFKYTDRVYAVLSDIYVKQKRYNEATDNLAQFITANPDAPTVPIVRLKMLSIWKVDEFKGRFLSEFDTFYLNYNPKSHYWEKNKNPDIQKKLTESLREYSLLVATYYQSLYQQTHQRDSFNLANTWYQRYLEHFTAYAQQDKVNTLYGELLAAENRNEEALHYFELAAYDGNIILNKEAAYATITLTNKLYEQNKNNSAILDKHIHYSLMAIQLYPAETRFHSVAVHAAELAFNSERYKDASALASSLPDTASEKVIYDARVIKGATYLKQQDFKAAEAIYTGLLELKLDPIDQKKHRENLAFAIYQQAETDLNNQQNESAIQHYARIAKVAPQTEIAPNGLYNAIVQSMKFQQWNNAIVYIQQFQKLYPNHALFKDTTKQLSTAYLNSDQGVKAAQTFEAISAQGDNQEVKMAALWKAAELYESKNNVESAIHSYENYAKKYTRPYPQYIEAMYKITQLYQKLADKNNVLLWQEKIAAADKDSPKSNKTERTNFIAANALVDLAKQKRQQFTDKRLVEPLTTTLRAKKNLMQETIALYSQASAYNDAAITTESTFAIANIYQEFSKALLASERPKALQGEELEQYNILLEDQAFPFEEKAIEFYEANLGHVKEGISTPWINQSYLQLSTLSPARYARKGKASVYKDEM